MLYDTKLKKQKRQGPLAPAYTLLIGLVFDRLNQIV